MRQHGFLRVVAASPELALADPMTNVTRTLEMLAQAEAQDADVVVFPECGLTGYTCHDLFHDQTLQDTAERALEKLLRELPGVFGGLVVVGLPVRQNGRLFNAAAVCNGPELMGVIPKTFLPNYKEFYDGRYFAPASASNDNTVTLAGQTVLFSPEILFQAEGHPECVIGVEICEDLWTTAPPSSYQALAGATVLLNLSASNETIGKVHYRRQLISQQSARCIAGYVYASSGPGESTTDLVFGGHCLVYEDGILLGESKRFEKSSFVVADLDLGRLLHERQQTNSFHGNGADASRARPFHHVEFTLPNRERSRPVRYIDAHPFVPSDPATLQERCEEIFAIQTTGLTRRLEAAHWPTVSIGVSGGLDSTLGLLVVSKAFERAGRDPKSIRAITMPGFGTTSRTKANADLLMQKLGVTVEEIDIRTMCIEQLKAIQHKPFGIDLTHHDAESLTRELRNLPANRRHDLVFENTQARLRTMLLMNAGFVLGTGDLSELALGWCTYNADHMSMYNPNASIPKTLVKFLVKWAAENQFQDELRGTLLDVVATGISPELLPTQADGSPGQSTEGTVGPFELHDFFLYHFLRHGAGPEKILFLAIQAKFDGNYSVETIRTWLGVFLKRFFSSQFKRSCLPDGPKVGSVSLSPRGDWRMPSDASARAWLEANEG
ncbi:MAG: NAD(+) synthase [Fimbriiglobus sp.]